MAEAKPEDGPVPSASAGGPASSRSRSLGFAWAAALPYAILVVAFGINAPFWDDFILFRPTESSGGASLEWLLKGHNEHRIAWSKALAECVRHTLGHLDFRVLGLVGNALLLPLAWVTLRLVGSPSFSLWLRVLAASLLFTPLSFEPLIWPTASTQAYGVLLFGAISFVLGARPGTWLLAGATCAAILATLASASGLLVLPIMGIVTLAKRWRRSTCDRADLRSSVLLIGLGVLLALAFKFFGSSRPTPTSFAGFIADPAIAGGRFLVLLGSPFRPYGFGLPSQVMNAVCLAGGLTFVCLLSWACRRGVIGRVLDERSATLMMLLFALGSAGSAAAGRVSLGIGQAASSRYVIVASIAWVLLASLFVRSRELRAEHGDTQTRRSPCWLIAVPVAYLSITTYGVLPTLRGRHDELEQSMEQWTQTSTGLIHGEGMSVEPMFARAIERGDFRLP